MAIIFVGSGIGTGATFTIPSHVVNDIFIVFTAFSGSQTPPTPAGAGGTVPSWVVLHQTTGANMGWTCAYFRATATNHTSGSWSNVSYSMIFQVRADRADFRPLVRAVQGGGDASITAS